VAQVGTTVVSDAARQTVRRNRGKIVAAVKKHGGTVAGVVLPVGIAIAAAKQIPKQRQRDAKKFADRELARTKKKLGKQRLTAEQEATLRQQYYEHALKKPVSNSYLGK